MSTLRTNALEGVDAKNSITIVAGAGNITTTNVQEGLSKASITFNGTSTVATRQSFNIASLVDDSDGNYSVNSTNGMSNSEYAIAGVSGNYNASNPGNKCTSANPNSSTDVSIEITASSDGSSTDTGYVAMLFYGDLA